ncbi:MAG: TolB family protein, partial [Pseudomonadales bacterium]
ILTPELMEQVVDPSFAADRPAWRPRSSTFLFNNHGDLWSVDLAEPRPFVFIENARNAAWSPSAVQLVFERGHEVWIARSDGLGQRRISGVDSRDQMFAPPEPSYSPDGSQLVYFDATQGPVGHIRPYDFDSGKTRIVVDNLQIADSPKFSDSGTSIWFHSSITGRTALWEVSTEANATPSLLLQGTSDDRNPIPVPDTSSIVYSATRDRFQLLATDIQPPARCDGRHYLRKPA